MRFTYSTTTGSVTRCDTFSISIEYCLPVPISQFVEYQLPMPRPPMFRAPTAFTSSSVPLWMFGSSCSPGDGIGSAFFAVVSAGLLAASLPSVLSLALSGDVSAVWVDCGAVEACESDLASVLESGAGAGVCAGGVWLAGAWACVEDADGVEGAGVAGCCAKTITGDAARSAARVRVRMKVAPASRQPCRSGATLLTPLDAEIQTLCTGSSKTWITRCC